METGEVLGPAKPCDLSSLLLSLTWRGPGARAPTWQAFILPWSRTWPPVLGQLCSVQCLSPQCPPNLHKLDGYYCDHEQV